MKIIFLDVDGVLHPASAGGILKRDGAGHFQENAMNVLAKIQKSTNAAIVLSSAWRAMPGGVKVVNKALQKYDIPKLLDCTPIQGNSRVAQIWTWLAQHRDDVDGYVCLDDSDLSEQTLPWGSRQSPLKDNFVRIPSSTGLHHAHASRAILKLNAPPVLPGPLDPDVPVDNVVSGMAKESQGVPSSWLARQRGQIVNIEVRHQQPKLRWACEGKALRDRHGRSRHESKSDCCREDCRDRFVFLGRAISCS